MSAAVMTMAPGPSVAGPCAELAKDLWALAGSLGAAAAMPRPGDSYVATPVVAAPAPRVVPVERREGALLAAARSVAVPVALVVSAMLTFQVAYEVSPPPRPSLAGADAGIAAPR